MISKYQDFMLSHFPYVSIIRFEDTMIFLGGICIGGIIMACFVAQFMRNLNKVDDIGSHKLRMVRYYNKDGKRKIIAVFDNFAESFHQVLILVFSEFFTIRKYTMKDEKRTKRFIYLISILVIIILILALLSIATVYESPK